MQNSFNYINSLVKTKPRVSLEVFYCVFKSYVITELYRQTIDRNRYVRSSVIKESVTGNSENGWSGFEKSKLVENPET